MDRILLGVAQFALNVSYLFKGPIVGLAIRAVYFTAEKGMGIILKAGNIVLHFVAKIDAVCFEFIKLVIHKTFPPLNQIQLHSVLGAVVLQRTARIQKSGGLLQAELLTAGDHVFVVGDLRYAVCYDLDQRADGDVHGNKNVKMLGDRRNVDLK